MPYVQGVYSDAVLNTAGQPMAGATVSLYAVSAWANGVLPMGSPPAPAPNSGVVAVATTDGTGSFSIRQLPPDDYHVLVTYTPPGGVLVALWRYNVSVGTQGSVVRSFKRGLGAAIPRTLVKLLTGQPVTIVCIGDGVTVGYNATGTVSGGWVARVAVRLAAAFPAAQVTRYDPNNYGTTLDAAIPSWTSTSVQAGTVGQIAVVNAGVTGDTALRCIRRLSNFTAATWFPPPDCYVVALGIGEMTGDATRQATPADYAAGLTGLVNLLRAGGAEALMLTPHAGPAPYLTAYAFDDYCNAARQAAASCGCGLIDVRQLWLDHYSATAPNDGFDPWMNTAGGDHSNPTDAGHQAIGDEVFKAFDAYNELPVPGRAGVGTELERVLLLNTAPTPLVFTGTWAALAQANNASGRDFTTSTTGDQVTFSARFSDLYMWCRRWKDSGQVTVTVDGSLFGTFDLYRANPPSTVDVADFNTALVPRDRLPLALGLADTAHSVTLKLAVTKNAASSGFTWRFDAVELLRQRQGGQVVESAAPLQKVQSGVVSCVLASANAGGANVTFAPAFPNAAPVVVATAAFGSYDYFAFISAPTQTGVVVYAGRRDGTNVNATVPVHWMAIG